MAKITELIITKSSTVQVEEYEPVHTSYTINIAINDGDDLKTLKEQYDTELNKWIEFDRLTWKSPNRAITAGKKLGVINKPF